MPAKNLYREAKEGIYSHIYNKGVEKRIIFNDAEDYNVFIGYLNDYLTPPQDHERVKKDFSVNGRMFRGAPHLPKNYFNKVELVAYSLMPDHFHLLLHQKTRGSLEGFIRSLCTRYSMYFNKKYHRTGALFEGPYKSVQITDEFQLLHLTRYLHYAGGYSSYPEYVGTRLTSWVKPEIVLSFSGKGTGDYKDFVEKYGLDQQDNERIEDITLESKNQHLERTDLASNPQKHSPEIPVESSEEIQGETNLKPLQRIPELFTTSVVFILLLALGIKSITVSATKNISHSPAPSVLSQTEQIEQIVLIPTPTLLPETEEILEIEPHIVMVTIGEEGGHVNIRQEPTTSAKKIGEAYDGDTFEFVSADSEWYGIKLADASTGFISAAFIAVMEGEINE